MASNPIDQLGGAPHGRPAARVDVSAAAVVTPTDRVRWSAVVAGLLAAITALVFLSVLGVALGLSTYDPGGRTGWLGTAAGWWAALSTLVAFAIGGCFAAYSAAVRGSKNGALNGAMIWVAAVPLLLFALAGGVTSLVGTAGTAAARAVGGTADGSDPTRQDAQDVLDRAQTAVARIQDEVTPGQVNTATNEAARAAWWTLLALGLGLAAATGGGYIGGRWTPADGVAVA